MCVREQLTLALPCIAFPSECSEQFPCAAQSFTHTHCPGAADNPKRKLLGVSCTRRQFGSDVINPADMHLIDEPSAYLDSKLPIIASEVSYYEVSSGKENCFYS